MRTFHVGLLALLFAALSLVVLDSACGGGEGHVQTAVPIMPTPAPTLPGGADLSVEASEVGLAACRNDIKTAGLTETGADTFAGRSCLPGVGDPEDCDCFQCRVDDVEMQEFRFEGVKAESLSRADRANGIEWMGYVSFSCMWRHRETDGQWGLWEDHGVYFRLRKVSGRWEREAEAWDSPSGHKWFPADASPGGVWSCP